MISVVLGEPPVYLGNDADFFTIVSQFDNLYTLYGDFQTRMERYWSLRWILQENLQQIEAIVVKGDLVRIDGLPFMQRVPGLPEDLERGRKVELRILGSDLVDLVMDSRLIRVLDESAETEDDEDEDAEGMPEALSAENADGAQSGAAEGSAENGSTVGA